MNAQERIAQIEQQLRAAISGEDVQLQKYGTQLYHTVDGLQVRYEITAYINNTLYYARAESIGKAIDDIVAYFHNGTLNSETVTMTESVYALFITDIWKTRKSRVFYGVFSTYNAAIDAAKELDLFTSRSGVKIIECTIDKAGEL
jgi:hypothetical protein